MEWRLDQLDDADDQSDRASSDDDTADQSDQASSDDTADQSDQVLSDSEHEAEGELAHAWLFLECSLPTAFEKSLSKRELQVVSPNLSLAFRYQWRRF